MLKRLIAIGLMLAMLLCGALAEAPEGGDSIRHMVTGDVSEFVVGEELDEAHESDATEAKIGTDVYLYVDPNSATHLTFITITEKGRPLAGVAIYLTYGGVTEYFGVTDENGMFSTYIFRNTPYEVTLEREGYRTENFEFTVTEEAETITVVMRKYHKLDLIVLENGKPVEGIKVQFSYNGKELFTDENGLVRFWPVAGVYDVIVTLPDGTTKVYKVRVDDDTLYVIDIGQDIWPEEMPKDTLEVGGGLGDLFIVYDKFYRPEDYDLTEMVFTDEEIAAQMDADAMSADEMEAMTAAYHAENEDYLHIVAEPDKIQHENAEDEIVLDEDGLPLYSQRSLILSGRQLLSIEEQGMESILFENENMGVWFDIADLYSENMARLFNLIEEAHAFPSENRWYIEGEFEVGMFEGKYEEMPDVWRWVDPIEESTGDGGMLRRDTFGDTMLEVRITPIMPDELARAVLGEEPNLTRRDLKERVRNVLLVSDEYKQIWLERYWADGHLTDTEYAELKQICAHSKAYRVQVFLRIDGDQINVTQMLPSLETRIDVNEEALAEAEEFAEAKMDPAKGDKDALMLDYLEGRYDMRHELMGVRNEGAQIEWREYEAGMALFESAVEITDGLSDTEMILAALEAKKVDIYDVDVRHEEYEFDKNAGYRYYAEVDCAKNVPLSVEADWQVRWQSNLSGLYLLREIGCDCTAVVEEEE